MFARYFEGKNWKLASYYKWKETVVDSIPSSSSVGMVKLDGEDFSVYPFESGFLALELLPEPLPQLYFISAGGGNINRYTRQNDDGIAMTMLKAVCDDFKCTGVVFRVDDVGLSKIGSYSCK